MFGKPLKKIFDNQLLNDSWGLNFIRRLKPAKWRYIAPYNDGKDHFGFIAQDIDEIAPREDYNFVVIDKGFMQVNYYEFIGPIIKAIQELDKTLNGIITVLSSRIERMQNQLNKLEEKVRDKERIG